MNESPLALIESNILLEELINRHLCIFYLRTLKYEKNGVPIFTRWFDYNIDALKALAILEVIKSKIVEDLHD